MSELTEQVRAYFSAMGKKGGSVKGSSKARTREQAQRAVRARWERYRLTMREAHDGTHDGTHERAHGGPHGGHDRTSAN